MGKDKIREFIIRKFPAARKAGLEDDSPLLESGIIDSLGVLEVVDFLETEFAVQIEDDDLTPENFQTVDMIDAFLSTKMAQGQARAK